MGFGYYDQPNYNVMWGCVVSSKISPNGMRGGTQSMNNNKGIESLVVIIFWKWVFWVGKCFPLHISHYTYIWNSL